jgi:hypothetical protein
MQLKPIPLQHTVGRISIWYSADFAGFHTYKAGL